MYMGKLEFKNNKNEIGSMRYTEENIQFALNNFFTPNSVKYAIDGQYVFEWESDKLIMMRTSGLVYEFEIKISKADFKNDFKNKQTTTTMYDSAGAILCKKPALDNNGMITSLYINTVNNFESPSGKALINSEILEYKKENEEG